jgi:hypothetical protein
MSGAVPIKFRRLAYGAGMPTIQRFPENNNCIAKEGTPIAITSGYVDKSAAITNANNLFLGFSTEYGKNRATDGTAETLHYGSVPNQANAVNIPVGAPMDDGNLGVVMAAPGVRFKGALTAANNSAASMLGAMMGLTEDSNNYWYVDPAKLDGANGACVRITELIDPVGTNAGLVEFEVIASHIQSLTLQA